VTATTLVSITTVPRGLILAPDNNGTAKPGDTITYTHRLTNVGQLSDTFVLEAASSLGWSPVVDPASVLLDAGQAAEVTVLMTVPMTPTGLTDTTTVTATSQSDPTVFGTAVDITTLDVQTGADFAPDRAQRAAPGETITYTHQLTNTGDVPLTFDFAVQETAPWSEVPISLVVDPGVSSQVIVTVTVPTGAGAGETHAVTVTAEARDVVGLAPYVRDVTTVTQIFGVALAPNRIGVGEPGDVVAYTHTLTNTGNGEDTFNLEATAPISWQVALSPGPFTVPRGAARPITVAVTIPADAITGTEQAISVRATSIGDPTQVATVTDTTRVDRVRTLTYLPLIMRAFEKSEGPDLIVTDITVTPASPAAGQSVTVQVTVRNQGSQPVAYGNNFYVDFYVDRVPQPMMVGDRSWGAQGAWFGVGETYTFEGTYTFDAADSYQLYAQVDTDDTVKETWEGNNQFGPQAITVTGSETSNVDETPATATPVSPRRPRPTPTPGMPENP
jgi:hypothetical protein